MLWENFEKGWLSEHWFDKKDRLKTLTALQKVVPFVPEVAFYKLRIIAFSGTTLWGKVFKSEGVTGFMYLDVSLENAPQSEVDFTIAHEFAHIVLDHWSKEEDSPRTEAEADALAETWGFSKPS